MLVEPAPELRASLARKRGPVIPLLTGPLAVTHWGWDEGPPQATTALASQGEGGDREMAAMVISSPEMPQWMKRHRDCLYATMNLEIELFGEVLSQSIVEPLERYSWWPFDREPPRASI